MEMAGFIKVTFNLKLPDLPVPPFATFQKDIHAAHLFHRVKVHGLVSWDVSVQRRIRSSFRDRCGATRSHTLPLLSAFTFKAISENKTLTAGIIMGLAIIFAIRFMTSPWRKLPPGPWRLPILGNIFQLRDKSWWISKDCKERFGKFTMAG